MDVEKCQTCPCPCQCPHPFILKSEKPATIKSLAPEPVVPETQVLPAMKVPMQYSTTCSSTVPSEPVVPETQVLPVMKVPMQYGTAGPSTVPPTQISHF